MPTADSTRRDPALTRRLSAARQDRAGQAGRGHRSRFGRSLIRSLTGAPSLCRWPRGCWCTRGAARSPPF